MSLEETHDCLTRGSYTDRREEKNNTRRFRRCGLWEGTIVARYGKLAQTRVERALREEKQGKLRSGRSGKKVTSRKQAIAIGLSEARKAGGKVPPAPKRRRSGRA